VNIQAKFARGQSQGTKISPETLAPSVPVMQVMVFNVRKLVLIVCDEGSEQSGGALQR